MIGAKLSAIAAGINKAKPRMSVRRLLAEVIAANAGSSKGPWRSEYNNARPGLAWPRSSPLPKNCRERTKALASS